MAAKSGDKSKGKSNDRVKSSSKALRLLKGKGAASKKTKPSKLADEVPAIQNTRAFYLDDLPKTLFPLDTNRVLVELGEADIQAYIGKCLDDQEQAYGFSPQRRVFVSKPQGYLRRTVKLDVVAEYYLYDVVFRNRALFRRPHTPERKHYGHRFAGGQPIPATQAYKAFKGGLSDYGKRYAHSRSMSGRRGSPACVRARHRLRATPVVPRTRLPAAEAFGVHLQMDERDRPR
jgi:hypothetical protein